MKKYIKFLLLSFLATSFLSSCLTKEIDLELPPFESGLAIECYLEDGLPARMNVTRTSDFFEPLNFEQLFVFSGIKAAVEYNGIIDSFTLVPFFDSLTGKFFTYTSNNIINLTNNTTYKLTVIDSSGKVYTSQTIHLPPVLFDTVRLQVRSADSLAFPLTQFTDILGEANYYRYFTKNLTASLDSNRFEGGQNFTTNDNGQDGQIVQIGEGYSYEKGDSGTAVLYHITREYYDFLSSIDEAINAASSPFGTPTRILSNINGGTGIFTTLSYNKVYFKYE